jgi:hypothetical protein
MIHCQICNEFSDKSVYILEANTIYEARKLAIEKFKQDTVHHINFYDNGVYIEQMYNIKN